MMPVELFDVLQTVLVGLLTLAGLLLRKQIGKMQAEQTNNDALMAAIPAQFYRTSSGLPNKPPPEIVPVLAETAARFHRFERAAIEEGLAQPPGLYVTSSFRSKAVNDAIGGNANSFHMQGRAVDFATDDPVRFINKMRARIDAHEFDVVNEIIAYPSRKFCHIAWSRNGQSAATEYLLALDTPDPVSGKKYRTLQPTVTMSESLGAVGAKLQGRTSSR